MDFSGLVDAVLNGDDKSANRYLTELTPILVHYLRSNYNADFEDAKDCSQQGLLSIIEAIRDGKIRDPDSIVSFTVTTTRNHFFKLMNRNKEQGMEEVSETPTYPAVQIENLVDEERQKILKICLEELKDDYRELIDYWFENPDAEATQVAEHFGISVNNAWTRKHRVVKMLNECYEKKMNS